MPDTPDTPTEADGRRDVVDASVQCLGTLDINGTRAHLAMPGLYALLAGVLGPHLEGWEHGDTVWLAASSSPIYLCGDRIPQMVGDRAEVCAKAAGHAPADPVHRAANGTRWEPIGGCVPGGRSEVLPARMLAAIVVPPYLSTACQTANACDEAVPGHPELADELAAAARLLRGRCRETQKFTATPCSGAHHQEQQ